jgi:beta-galactosidase
MTRRIALWLTLLAGTPLIAQDPFFPMAVWYGGGKARAPMLEENPRAQGDAWRKDLEQIKSLGFNSIRCWVDWATAEPVEGQFNFDTVAVLGDLAREVGLKLIIQVYVDSAPDWVGKKYPDAHFESIGGEKMPSESAPGFCFDHPGVRQSVLALYTALAERVKDQPAFYGWDLWSEPHIINWAQALYLTNPEFCFCPYSQARYRAWLQKKYRTLQALNQAWYRRFTDWNEVQPNRLGTILSYTDFIDWRWYIREKLAEDLKMRYDAVKRVLPNHVATSHAASPNLFTSPLAGDGSPDDWMMAGVVDFWGTSFYPKHSFAVGRDVPWRGALLDFTRSVGLSRDRGFWVGELQGGFGTIALRVSSTVTPEDLRIWTWSALARGAKAINYYAWYPMSSGYESGGFGMINLDGTITERAREAGSVARLVSSNQKLFLEAKPIGAEVAIVFNPLPYFVGGRRPIHVSAPQGEFVAIERNSMLGIYRALFPLNVPVDFIHINEVASGKASQYKLVFLPYPLMVSRPAARALVEYVRGGGTLVAEARAAWNDERGRATEIIPGSGLHEVCACRETAVQQTASGTTEITIAAADPSIPLLSPGDKVTGMGYQETLEPISERGRIVARFPDGGAAMVASNFGKGQMLTIGSFLGQSYEMERDENVAKLLRGTLDWAGVRRPIEVRGASEVEVRVLDSGGGKLVVAFNHGAAPAEPVIRISGSGKRLRELTGNQAVLFESRQGSVQWKQIIPPGGVRVFHLTAQ